MFEISFIVSVLRIYIYIYSGVSRLDSEFSRRNQYIVVDSDPPHSLRTIDMHFKIIRVHIRLYAGVIIQMDS